MLSYVSPLFNFCDIKLQGNASHVHILSMRRMDSQVGGLQAHPYLHGFCRVRSGTRHGHRLYHGVKALSLPHAPSVWPFKAF